MIITATISEFKAPEKTITVNVKLWILKLMWGNIQ